MTRSTQPNPRATTASAAKSPTSGASTAGKSTATKAISKPTAAVASAMVTSSGRNTRSTANREVSGGNRPAANDTGASASTAITASAATHSANVTKRSSRLATKRTKTTTGGAVTQRTTRSKPGKNAKTGKLGTQSARRQSTPTGVTTEAAAPDEPSGAQRTEAGGRAADRSPIRFTALTVAGIKAQLRTLGLPTDGRKAALVERLASGTAPQIGGTEDTAAELGRGRGSYNPSRHSNIVDFHIDADTAVLKAAKASAPTGARMFSPECQAKVAAMLGDADTTALFNLPETFNGFEEAIAPVLGRAVDVKARFRRFVAEQREAWSRGNPEKRPQGSSQTFALPNTAAGHFFNMIGTTHGSRTKSYTCDVEGCTEQHCCPKEYNFSTITTYAERLAADSEFAEHANIFSSKEFKAYVRAGETRQQTCGRGSLPAPPILLPDAEAIVMEARSYITQARADFHSATDTKGKALAAYNAVRGASCKAVFAVDLCTGKRAADITSTLSKDVLFTGTGNRRKIAAYNRTNKVLLPVRPWMVDARPNSVLCPIKAMDEYLAVCCEFGVPIGKLSNGENDTTPCSCYLFPFISKDEHGYPCVTNARTGRNGFKADNWEHVTTSQCNAWLKQMLERLGGTVTTDYTFHGSRSVAALVALAEGTSIEAINATHGWRAKSEQARSYARLVQLQSMTQEPVLRDTLASTLLASYSEFFK